MADSNSALLWLECAVTLLALSTALSLRPWRMLEGPLLTPTLAAVALLPWFWLMPQHLPQGLQIQLSGASLLVLMLGWPLAVPVLALIGMVVWAAGHHSAQEVLSQWVWMGLVPASISLALGAGMRRWLPPNPFVYTLGRGFLGSAMAVFMAGFLFEGCQQLAGISTVPGSLVARWLMAWGDGFLTGMLSATFVAFVPQWLATWSDARYLQPPN